MKKIVLFFAALFITLCSQSQPALAQSTDLTDWVVRDFKSEIVVNKDSSLDITELITADCGNLSGKHGIFRVIPYQSYGENGERFTTKISLREITDFAGDPYNYATTRDKSNKTISWKIGDANKTVSGVNYYKIRYHVENAIRTGNADFDELYWNLNGNFWELNIEKYQAKITFPSDLDSSKFSTSIYSGSYGAKDTGLASYKWEGNTLTVDSNRTLYRGEGITASVSVPKGFFIPYTPTFLDKYGTYLYYLIPLAILILCIGFWGKFGRDPHISWTIAPEFEIPEKLGPIELGMVLSDGAMSNKFLTAGIIFLAVNKYLTIEKVEKKGIFGQVDYTLKKTKEADDKLSSGEKTLFNKLFGSSQEIKLSSLKNSFYKHIPKIETGAMNYVEEKGWVASSSRYWMIGFIVFGIIITFLAIVMFSFDTNAGLALLIGGIIVFIFAPLMKKRTKEGALLTRRIKGFELYIKKAELYRQQWFEKQNIFETFLPYAVLFGIAKQWTQKMKDIYGEEFINHYHPLWYSGYVGNFNFDDFSHSLSDMSSQMATTLSSSPSSSGSGGGGFSGGGGGGGGGGGW